MHARIKLVSETEVHVATHAHYPDSYAVKIVNGEWFPTVEYAGVWDTAGLEALDLCIKCFPQTGSFAALSDESATEFSLKDGVTLEITGIDNFMWDCTFK